MTPKTIASTATLLAATLLSGCAAGWHKDGLDPQQIEAAKTACKSQAVQQIPPANMMVMVRPGRRTPQKTVCDQQGSRSTCITSGGDYYPPEYEERDVNEDPRRAAFNTCMMQGGFRFRWWQD